MAVGPSTLVTAMLIIMAQEPLVGTNDQPDGRLDTDDDAEQYVRSGTSAQLGIHSAQVSVSRSHEMLFQHSTVSFHIAWLAGEAGRRTPTWFARRRTAKWRDITTEYADGRTCSGIGHALTLAAELTPPILSLRGIPINRSERPSDTAERDIVLDDWTFTLTADGVWPTTGAYAEFSTSGGSISPLAALYASVDSLLDPCWSRGMPADLV